MQSYADTITKLNYLPGKVIICLQILIYSTYNELQNTNVLVVSEIELLFKKLESKIDIFCC